MIRLLLFLSVFITIQSKRHCRIEKQVLNYFKVKTCHRSTLPVIFLSNVDKVEQCIKLAKEKKGLAFNFHPKEARKYAKGFTITCQILGCPEILNSTTLIPDIGFDYYSPYGNWTATQNATCIKSVGLFTVFPQKLNYINSIINCQEMGAELADVISEVRTKYLSNLINETLTNWYKVAYVGLDDTEQEGEFINSFDRALKCYTYRSWAPGHPISNKEDEDCVVLDDNRMWRVVDCQRKMPAICEFYPEKPQKQYLSMCQNINSTILQKKCIEKYEAIYEMAKNLTRPEQCILLTNGDDINVYENNTNIINLD